MATRPDEAVVWQPQSGPQKALVDCPLPEVFYGGARGGGKTDGVLGKWALKEQQHGETFNAVMFRRTTVSADDAIERARQIYEPLGGKYNSSKNQFRMPNGGRVSFRYLENIADADEYQGRNLTDAWVEEAGQYATPAPIDRIQATLRSTAGVPTQLILTANPGGAGQHWLRERYQLFPLPKEPTFVTRVLPNGAEHNAAVIPSRIYDNQVLMAGDPDYINRLYLSGSEKLVQAWLEGDWSAIEGAYFEEFSIERHVLRAVSLPDHWHRFRAGDWGSAKPFAFGWFAVASEDWNHPDGTFIPKGALVQYLEWYGMVPGQPDVGLKMDASEVGAKIRQLDDEGVSGASSVLDPSAFAVDGGPSIAERMYKAGALFRRADNRRVASRGAMGGWDLMRERLKGDGEHPMLYFFDNCKASIRTIPALQHDDKRPEDLDTDQEDHAADMVRYACMSRPYMRPRPKSKENPRRIPSFNEMIAMQPKRGKERI